MPNLIEVQKASYDQFLLVKEPAGRPARRGPAGRVQVGVPDLGLLQHRAARIRRLRIRAAEIRRRRVPPARHDLRRAAQGEAAPDRVRYRRGDRRPLRQGHQGAGRLHGRHPAHDQQRHVHRQRHRARHRLADAPLARRVLRPRQGQDPLLGQAPVRRPHHPLSRLLARHRVRRQGHRLCAHRPAPQDSGDVAAAMRSAWTARRSSTPSTSRSPYKRQKDGWRVPFDANRLRGYKAVNDLVDADTGKVVVEAGKKITVRQARQLAEKGLKALRMTDEELIGHYIAEDLVNAEDRRDLRRGRRRDHREDAQGAQRGGLQGNPDPRHRPRQRRRLHPQHAARSTRT